MTVNKLSFFASGNGDSVLLKAGGTTIMTDIHYCQGHADPDDDSKPDFTPQIRDACTDDCLDLFVLTHPDKDHVRGAGDVFYLGPPEDWVSDPDEGDPLILIKEIWCSPYAANGAYDEDESKLILGEIRRRKELQSTPAADKDGNRLVVRSVDDAVVSGRFGNAEWRVLAPTQAEAHIPEPKKGELRESCNPTSLGIRWTVTVNGGKNHILLLGDATVAVLERIHDKILLKDPAALDWHVLLAVHHCSRRSLGWVVNPGKDEEFIESKKALKVLGRQLGSGYVVSSSRRFGRDVTPPSSHARNRYYKILAETDDLTKVMQADRDRFLVTGSNGDGKPEHVIFDLTASGPSRRKQAKPLAAPAVASSVGGGGSYG
ncbi:hypothetical protein JL100_000695 [Skermanella mucosa]|uniref:hypothetical protein n=1 Tax=Skermanella mucosa TaxID=1789672 RepID=UPI00192B0CFB|nr:hypothetical protein [Skermanella mucosa]UEM21338.1 hypothetical protein JL100_000695 [Skermanella mucosa]